MAAINLSTNGYTSTSPLEGRMNFNQGVFLVGGRGAFNSTDATGTTPPRSGTKVVWAFGCSEQIAGTSSCGAISYSVGSDGTITWQRSLTVSGGAFSFLVAYCG